MFCCFKCCHTHQGAYLSQLRTTRVPHIRRSRDNIRTVLQSVYLNQAAVDDELVDIIYGPSEDQGALEVFVSVISGQ